MFFPQDLVGRALSPVNFFISVIQPRRFFIVVNRKVVENYKLNLFDVNLEKFEIKLVGGTPQFQSLDLGGLDEYYAYQIWAYFNWYRFYSPGNIATWLSMLVAWHFFDVFKKHWWPAVVLTIRAVFDFVFIFAAKLKLFDPFAPTQQQFNWMINTFKNYIIIRERNFADSKLEKPEEFFKDLFSKIEFFKVFFFILHRLQRVISPSWPTTKYYQWLLKEQGLELRGDYKEIVEDFFENRQKIVYSQEINFLFLRIADLILPADNLVFKYVIHSHDWHILIPTLLGSIFDKKKVDSIIKKALKDEDPTKELLDYLLNYKIYKNTYFTWIKKFMVTLFSTNQDALVSEEEIREIEEMVERMARGENIPNFQMPERLRQESIIMERLLNFYVSWIGGLWVGRWDNFEMRLLGQDFLAKASNALVKGGLSAQDMDFLFGMLDNYYTNEFYYRYIFGHVKAWEEEVRIPLYITWVGGYHRDEILNLLIPTFVTYLFEDTNQKDIKVFVEEKAIIEDFAKLYGKQIKAAVSKKDLVKQVYGFAEELFGQDIYAQLKAYIDEEKLKLLKDSLYTYDFWVYEDFKKIFLDYAKWDNLVSPVQQAGILGWTRETFLWFLLVLTFYQKMVKEMVKSSPISLHLMGVDSSDAQFVKDLNDSKLDKALRWMERLYWVDIIGIRPDVFPSLRVQTRKIFDKNRELLDLWLNLDENKKILNLWWKFYKKNLEATRSSVFLKITEPANKDEIAWYRNFFRGITYYNKRYLIPHKFS